MSAPRVLVHPPLEDTRAGDAAVLLAGHAGMPLEPWQAEGLRLTMNRRADGRWAAFEAVEICSRQNGKTAAALVRALAGFLLLGERTILWSAHEVKTSMRAWRDIRQMLVRLGREVNDNLIDVDGVPVKVVATNGAQGFERLDTGAEIKMVARSKGSGRGFSADLLVIDEAFAYTDEHADALMPTLTARPNPQVLYASSPPLDGETARPMYALRKRAETGRATGLVYRDWGAADVLDDVMDLPDDAREAYLDDRARWAATNPARGLGRVTDESIERNRAALSEQGFAREVLGLWPREVDAAAPWPVIRENAWRARAGATERPARSLALAVAGSFPNAERAAIAAAGRARGEVVVQIVRHDVGTSWLPDELARLVRKHGPFGVVVDPLGTLDGDLADLRKACGRKLIEPNTHEVAAAGSTLYNAATGDAPFLRHWAQADLDHAVATADTRPLVDRWRWKRTEHSAPLEAASLAVWAVVARSKPAPPAPRAVPDTDRLGADEGDLLLTGF